EAGGLEQLKPHPIDQRERQVAVGDRRAERALLFRPLDVHVDPLVVAAQIGERVDVALSDLLPLTRADLLPHELLETVDSLDLDRRHAPHPTVSPPVMNTPLTRWPGTNRALAASASLAIALLVASCGGGGGGGNGPGPTELSLVIGNSMPLSGDSSEL